MGKTGLIALAVVLLSFLAGICLYPQMPDPMASHWNAQGAADGTMPKFFGVFLMPSISLILLAVFTLLPKMDPLKANIAEFRPHYDNFTLLLILFLAYLHSLVFSWNLNIGFSMPQMLVPAFCILFYFVGVLTENAKRNWFIGVRTPWTMSSDAVWDKTNKLSGKLFKFSGAIALLGIFFKENAILFVVLPALLTAAVAFAYSYFEYQRQKN